jgi:5-methylcytosine-specific restriction endonuclease McrA
MSQIKKLIREKFRIDVFSRDKNKCRKCDEAEDLDAHHITDRNEMPNGGYVKENGISLCPPCHEKAEVWHNSDKTEFVDGYHPNDLYRLINCNEDLAKAKSLVL